MAVPLRWLLLHGVILPFRPRRSAHAYQQIWTEDGSPLAIHTADLERAVSDRLGDRYVVSHGMRYRNPSIESALDELTRAGCDRIIAVPLFPQYASSSGGSAVAKLFDVAATKWNVPNISVVPPFYGAPEFIEAVTETAEDLLEDFAPDHVLFSYHGLPIHHIVKSHERNESCVVGHSPCRYETSAKGRSCYVAHCYATSRALAHALGLRAENYSTSFQSRLAGQKWLKPYTDHTLIELAESGQRRVAVLTPSFAADCLETTEEIGIRGRAQFTEAGGTDLLLVPCVNASPAWADGVVDLVHRQESEVSAG